LSAAGPFVPGVPFLVRAVAVGRHAAPSAELELLVTDDGAELDPRLPGAGRALRRWSTAVGPGTRQENAYPIVFGRSGYYRVTAIARSDPEPSAARWSGDSLIRNLTIRHLWIVVNDSGGRLTTGYDTTAIPRGLRPMYGAYGPFVAKAHARPPGGQPLLLNGPYAQGFVRYRNYDLAGAPLTGVPGARVQTECYGKSDPTLLWYDLQQTIVVVTAADGSFVVDCGSAHEYAEGLISFVGANETVQGEAGAFAGAYFATYGGETMQLAAANDYAARVFINLRTYIPIVFTRFGASKGPVTAYVSDANTLYGPDWCTTGFANCPGFDVIRMNWTGVFDLNRPNQYDHYFVLFTTLHEYGHSYHYYAVSPFGGEPCGQGHVWSGQSNLGCSFREGVAHWVAMTAIGPAVTSSPFGGDWGTENDYDGVGPGLGFPTNPPTGNDPIAVEGAIASFLYDLIDSDMEPDGLDGGVGPPEDFDILAAPAATILARLKHCWVDGAAVLTGADQLIYCLEGSTSAYTQAQFLSPLWRSFTTLTYAQGVPPLNAAMVRALWEYNLYGIQ
jgi:hypothetical protein